MDVRPPRAARRVSATWHALATGDPGRPPVDPAVVAALPDPARRWLTRAAAPGLPARDTVVLAMHGRIRVGRWCPFTARQVIAARRGYVWAANPRLGPVPMQGYDLYADGAGAMRWRLAGVVPLVTADGADVSRSAAGRLAAEIVLTPAAALGPGVRWEPVDAERAVARVTVAGTGAEYPVTVEVDPAGALRSVRLPRWGDPAGRGYAEHEFVVRCAGEHQANGYRLPARFTAGWTVDGAVVPFFEAEVDAATFR